MASLRALARLSGIQPDYRDGFGRMRRASDATLIALLRALGVEIEAAGDAETRYRDAVGRRHEMILPPVIALWGEGPHRVCLRLPPATDGMVRGRLVKESGEQSVLESRLGKMHLAGRRALGGIARELRLVELGRLGFGYHRLTIESDAGSVSSNLVVAPPRTWKRAESAGNRAWGLFAPLHALRSDQDRRVGTLANLVALAEWSARLGAGFVGLLPVLACGDEISPYSPLSRLFWSGRHLEPEWVDAPLREAALEALSLPAETADPDNLRERLSHGHEVDYAGSERRTEELIDRVQPSFERLPIDHERRRELQDFLTRRPAVRRFCRFRAVAERHGSDWRSWPVRLRSGDIEGGDYDSSSYRRHVIEQWLAEVQWRRAARACSQARIGLYLDLPIGAPVASFDVWARPDLHVLGCHVGAPPDAFFRRGQDWGIAPLHPEASRRDGHGLWRECLQHHMAVADLLRIDHVMGLHRLFWIPAGGSPEEGTYVRYHAQELYAVMALESHRNRTVIVGEDLGTVSAAVTETMARRGVASMYVLQSRITDHGGDALWSLPVKVMASLGTHDMPTWSGYWSGADIDRRLALGRLSETSAASLRNERVARKAALIDTLQAQGVLADDTGAEAVIDGCLRLLATGRAEFLCVDLDDLLAETLAHNIPGAAVNEAGGPAIEAANWRRTNRLGLSELLQDQAIAARLRQIDACRRRTPGK